MIWDVLDARRKELGLSRRKLAILANISPNTFQSAYERKSNKISYISVIKLSKVLGLDPVVLMPDIENLEDIKPYSDESKGLPKVLKGRRKMLGLTQRQLAEKSGLSVGAIGNYEAGNRKEIPLKEALALCSALEMTIDEFSQEVYK